MLYQQVQNTHSFQIHMKYNRKSMKDKGKTSLKSQNNNILPYGSLTITDLKIKKNRYWEKYQILRNYQGFPGGSDGKESTHNVEDPGSIPGSGRSPGEGNGYLLQNPWLENPWTEEPGRLQSRVAESNTTEQLTFFFFFPRN